MEEDWMHCSMTEYSSKIQKLSARFKDMGGKKLKGRWGWPGRESDTHEKWQLNSKGGNSQAGELFMQGQNPIVPHNATSLYSQLS